MDIGSSGWLQNVDRIAEKMEESLSLEGTVVAQRASELREEAQKVSTTTCDDVLFFHSSYHTNTNVKTSTAVPVLVCLHTPHTASRLILLALSFAELHNVPPCLVATFLYLSSLANVLFFGKSDAGLACEVP